MLQFHKAERRMSRLRLGIAGPAGSGKTYSAILIAFGMGGRVALIDTERGSGELYAHLGEYDVCAIRSPFEPEKYMEAVRTAESSGYQVIIIDSLSHAWSGEGGLLDQHGHLADRSGNSWSAWRQVTPKHNQLVEAMLQSTCHVIATMRSKTEYAQVTENGKTVVKKLGMNPVQRDGMEYEFTLFLDMDLDHVAKASKDRTSLFDGKFFKPSADTGKTLIQWLGQGEENGKARSQKAEPEPSASEPRKGNGGNCNAQEQEPGASTPTGNASPKSEGKPSAGGGNPKGNGNGAGILFAKLGAYGIDREAYKAYCHKKYGIESMKEMTASQREEQIRILNSLRSPERLEAFRQMLAEASVTDKPGEGTQDGEDQAPAPPPPPEPPPGQAPEFNYF